MPHSPMPHSPKPDNKSPETATQVPPIKRAHLTRLRAYWRGSGWPHHDNIDLDLLAAGLIEADASGHRGFERYVTTDTGLAAIQGSLARNRAARSAHAQLQTAVAELRSAAGEVVFLEPSLRIDGVSARTGKPSWRICQPDVFTLVPSLKAADMAPTVYEIKVSRADFLGELKKPEKLAGYRQISERF